jgi:RNA polymerase sigma-70 factor (ECF subfamily)
MTVASTSMSILVRQPTPRTVESPSVPSAASGTDDEARRIVANIARGDEAAFQQLYDRYHRRLLRLALVLARGDETLAQDTVQFVFVTAAKKLRRVDDENHLWNWLARIARQHIIKSWRRRNQDLPVVEMERLPESVDGKAGDSQLEESLDAALLLMEASERELIESFYFDRLSHKQIAEQLEVSPKAISSRLERAREKLRALIARNLSRET